MTTLNLQVASSSDDAFEESGGTIRLDWSYIAARDGQTGGCRLNNVTVPQGATIDDAQFQIYIVNTDVDDVDNVFYCEDEDDPGTFTSTSNDITDRTTTSESESVSAGSVGGGWYSVTVTDPVQEVVDRGGFSGDDLVILVYDDGSATLRWTSYDSDSSKAAKLDIDYTETGVAGPLVNSIPLKSLVHGGLAQCI